MAQFPDQAAAKRLSPAIPGYLLGMGLGAVIASLFGANPVIGLGMGSFVGVVIGVFLDKTHPKRSRWALLLFALAVFGYAAYRAIV